MPSLDSSAAASQASDTSEPEATSTTSGSPAVSRSTYAPRATRVGRERRLALQRRHGLPRQRQRHRPARLRHDPRPRERRLHRVGRADHGEARDRAQRVELLDRLVRRPVLAHEDRVVREDEGRARAHQRGEPERRPHVVAEHQEGAGVRQERAVERDAVRDRGHRMLAHAEVDVAAGEGVVALPDRAGARPTVVLFEPARSAEPPISRPGASAAMRPSAVPECLRVASALPSRPSTSLSTKSAGTARVRTASQLFAASACAPRQAASFASSVFALRALRRRALRAVAAHRVGHEEGRRLAGCRASAWWRAATSAPNGPPCTFDWPAHGLPWPIVVRSASSAGLPGGVRRRERAVERGHVLAVERLDVPALRAEARRHVLAEGPRGRAVDGHLVVVVEHDQVVELPVAGERGALVGDAFHQVAVARDHEDAVLARPFAAAAEARARRPGRERHADGVAEALPERAGGDLDAGRVAVLGVPRRLRVELAELPDLVEREPVAEQVQQRVEQHRGVARGEHEAVAQRPGRVASGRSAGAGPTSWKTGRARPIGAPRCPIPAASTASMVRPRMVFSIWVRSAGASSLGIDPPSEKRRRS